MRSLLESFSKKTIFLGGFTVLYLGITLANLGDDYNLWRWIFLAALVGLTLLSTAASGKTSLNLVTVFKWVHLFLAVLYFWGAVFGKWAKRGDPDEGALSAEGGTGFGLIAVILAVALLALAIMRLMGKSKVLPGLGVEQLTVILGAAAWMNILAFVVGWLATFEAGTGWGVVVAYFPASLIPQLGAITLSATKPATTISELDSGKRRAFSIVTLLAGIGITAFPFLAYISSGNISLSALDGKVGDSLSGPRFGYMLLIFGVFVIGASLMRLRPQGLAEPGPNALLGHGMVAVGLVTFLVPFATLISIMRHKADLSAGLGLWLGLLAGLALIVMGVVENLTRGAIAA